MIQKFKKLSFVQIGKDTAIIDGTYSQIYGGTNISEYQVYILNPDVLTIKEKRAWIHEDEIQPIIQRLQNPDFAEELIESYNLRI